MNSKYLWPLLVAGLTVLFFLPALQGEFLHWDDYLLFVENPYYRGLSWVNWQWMCTTVLAGHWQPLTWLSCALDYKAWNLNAFGWHVTNLLIHAVNAVLIYWLCLAFLRQRQSEKKTHPAMTDGAGCYVAAALAALFWAVHPLRVEAVAWLSTRGYLLCTTFCLLTILFYLRETGQKRYPLAALLCFTLATCTKGIGMMLPFVLLLLDWLKCRTGILPVQTGWKPVLRSIGPVILEKFPFFALSLVTGVTAFLAKRADGGMVSVEQYGLVERFGQSLYGFWFYLLKTVWPLNLSPLYEKHPEFWQVLAALMLSTSVLIFLFLFRRRLLPIIGTFSAFLLLIFPMLGITQSGVQITADRFTYLPALPFAVMLAFGLSRIRPARRKIMFPAAMAVGFLFAFQTLEQTLIWKDDMSLWHYAAQLDPLNFHASKNLADASISSQRQAEGVSAMRRAIDYAARAGDAEAGGVAYNSLGLIYFSRGEHESALEAYSRAIALNPNGQEVSFALHNRALLYYFMGRPENALSDLDRALKNPGLKGSERDRGLLLRAKIRMETGDPEGADEDCKAISPRFWL